MKGKKGSEEVKIVRIHLVGEERGEKEKKRRKKIKDMIGKERKREIRDGGLKCFLKNPSMGEKGKYRKLGGIKRKKIQMKIGKESKREIKNGGR